MPLKFVVSLVLSKSKFSVSTIKPCCVIVFSGIKHMGFFFHRISSLEMDTVSTLLSGPNSLLRSLTASRASIISGSSISSSMSLIDLPAADDLRVGVSDG
ncbi:ATP synthase subunit alpha 1 [Striga asiatica]|uniref:ATP synthase subunit alpha 1 n=1 Tax=Striga asiatica TaxID=4170 RepID=A0A5A7P374_STRAF|nr:ATP synthase subunit alpha 1 [Striga asiatica]